jgi:hypothetical protein
MTGTTTRWAISGRRLGAKFHPHPQISGKNGGQSQNLHQFACDGVVLLGHVRNAHERQLKGE